MNDFWNGKSLEMVTRDYLCSALDSLDGWQPINIEGIVERLCKNMTVKKNARSFVADYFDDAIAAIKEYRPDSSYRLSEYDKTVNLMLTKTAKDLLERCDTAMEYEGSYHVWKRNDIESLRSDLEELSLSNHFQRAADVKFESLDNYSYRFLNYVLKGMEGQTVKLSDLAMELPLAKLSEQDARNFIKGNFEDAMTLLDTFRDSGFKTDYSDPKEMMQSILYQQQKEILSENPYLEDLIVYDGVETVKLDRDFIENLTESLEQQRNNVKLSKFEEITHNIAKNFVPKSNGRVVDLNRKPGRIEVIY